MTTTAIPDNPGELTTYIETHYHARHREVLPHLASLAAKVEQVHANAPHVPAGLADVLRRMIGDLEVHMKKEEIILFPAIRQGRTNGIYRPIAAMRGDHDDHEADVARIRELTENLTLPAEACRTWRTLYEELGDFLGELEAHIQLENNVLFPQFEVQH
ncbi:MAG: hemerythrin domain-containing protein [Hyphomicrobium sp.]|nr:hemerythrin domain-containing protein [Hyphomicrobium sp.]